MLTVNNFTESLFADVSTQVQVFGKIGRANVATVSNMKRNGFFCRPTWGSGYNPD
jgi:hypothetical protein